jgi:hypothetical protein
MEERELTMDDLQVAVNDVMNRYPLLFNYCKGLVLYNEWWNEVATVRAKYDRLMRALRRLMMHYKFCFEEPRYPKSTCKRLRRRLESHAKGAEKLRARVDELIETGEGLEVRGRNYYHLMVRLSRMMNGLSIAIEEASKLLARGEVREAEGGSAVSGAQW